MSGLRWTVMCGVAAWLSACASVQSPPTLEETLSDARVSRLSVTRTPEGLLTVPVSVNSGEVRPFLIDTGATRSAVFADHAPGMALEPLGKVRVHGLDMKRVVALVRAKTLGFGANAMRDVEFAVLPKREGGQASHGIIGMDILRDYRLYARADIDELVLIPDSLPAPSMPRRWSVIELQGNPWEDDARDLKYLTIRMNGHVAPALLDFGSDANIVNFAFATFPEVRQLRRRLKETYDVQGAVGTFRPRVQVSGVDFRAGSRVWEDEDFIVKDMDSLDIIGVKSRPFMIAGANLFADRTFYLDFQQNVLRMPKSEAQMIAEGGGVVPDKISVQPPKVRRPTTGSRVGGSSATVIQATPEARNR